MKNKVQGIIILAAGLIILFWGYTSSRSISSLGSALSSGTFDRPTITMIVGGLCTAFGFFKLFKIR